MTSLLPLKSATQSRDRDLDPQLLGLTEESAGDILSAISSLTARRILDILYDEPRPTSEIATTLDSSVQNVSYHLERLEDADLVEVVDTWYSAQGREMDVYGPTNSALVLYTGAETVPPSLKRALGRSVGGIGAIGVISALVHFQWTETGPFAPSRRVAPIGAQPPEPTIQESIMNFITGPGGTLLTAGLVVIAVCLLWWYWRRYRPARQQAQSI